MPNPCKNKCTPNEMLCKGCGRTEAERTFWASIPEPVQLDIIDRIDSDRQKRYALQTNLAEIRRLNSIIADLNIKAGITC